jgi:muramoyltetrapeptide carboxypeptidase
MMMALKRAGKLKGLAGIVVGGLSDMKDNAVPFGKTAEEIILEHIAEYDYPVCFNFPAGHIKDNRTIIMGKNASVIVGDECKFIQ